MDANDNHTGFSIKFDNFADNPSLGFEPYILGINSSTSTLKIGLSLPEYEVAILENNDRYRHSEFIYEMIDRLLSENNVDKKALKMIVVSTGPGSFTGLRVGLATAKGLAISLGIPLVGLSNFEMLALNNAMLPLSVLIQSRKNEFYLGKIENPAFDNVSIEIVRTDEIKSKCSNSKIVGIDIDFSTLDIEEKNILSEDEWFFSAETLIIAGSRKYNQNGGDDLAKIEPLYIQNFPAKPQK